jgi:sugar lactone lactonase YvrE
MGGLISTVAGDGGEYRFSGFAEERSPSLSRPYGIALDVEGNLYITDSDSHLIRRWDRTTNSITPFAGSGRAEFGGEGGDPLLAASTIRSRWW